MFFFFVLTLSKVNLKWKIWENIPRQGGNAHSSAFLVRETYKQILILRVDHCRGKEKKFYK